MTMPTGTSSICQEAARLVHDEAHAAPNASRSGPRDSGECLRIVAAWEGASDASNAAEVHQWMLDAVQQLVGAGAVGVFELTPDRHYLRLVAARGMEEMVGHFSRGLCLGVGRIAAAAEGRAAFGEEEERPDDEERLACEEGLQACVPVRAADQVLGAVAIYSARSAQELGSSDHSILLAIGRHGGALLARLAFDARSDDAVHVA
jgi:GAF domain-containing protein